MYFIKNIVIMSIFYFIGYYVIIILDLYFSSFVHFFFNIKDPHNFNIPVVYRCF